jgi:hypothetical protein
VAEDEGKKDEDKIDFTADGEALGYISLDQAVIQARQLARQQEDQIRERLGWQEIVWSTLNSELRDDSYWVHLQFRRPVRGVQEEQTGEEEFLFNHFGEIIDRQIVLWPDSEHLTDLDTLANEPPDVIPADSPLPITPAPSQAPPPRGKLNLLIRLFRWLTASGGVGSVPLTADDSNREHHVSSTATASAPRRTSRRSPPRPSGSRVNTFAVQGASSPTWTYIGQGYSPDPRRYDGELLQDGYSLVNWVELESANGRRVVVGRDTATKHYGVKLPPYRPKNPETPDWPSK